MPPKPTTPIASANHTCGRVNAFSSPVTDVTPREPWCGIHNHTATTVSNAMTATRAYGHCQPRCCPSHVETGTPTMFATVRPASIIDTAQVRRCFSTRVAATTAPMPKNAPCGMPATKRASSSIG